MLLSIPSKDELVKRCVQLADEKESSRLQHPARLIDCLVNFHIIFDGARFIISFEHFDIFCVNSIYALKSLNHSAVEFCVDRSQRTTFLPHWHNFSPTRLVFYMVVVHGKRTQAARLFALHKWLRATWVVHCKRLRASSMHFVFKFMQGR